ncbi:MAG: chemotaxis-specific protein-glutamate methyltransferase CheB [Nitrospirae bacterium]|nr:chemotaxis-specific protein-glutamate methyltransferase CheB [Nitrospirota bacterium]
MINVLIVEDSLVVRKYLKHILESDKTIRVIGTAEDGMEAVEFVREKRPDVITMDINMPGMNGLEATRQIMETNPVPIVIVSASYNRKDVEKSFRAMEAGAVAIVEKPAGNAHPDYYEATRNLIQTVKLMSEIKVVRRLPRTRPSRRGSAAIPQLSPDLIPERIKLVAIGASTGGPPVIQAILAGLQKGFPAPLLVVQHIAKGFLKGLTEWLKETTGHPVHIAKDGERILQGHIYFAPDDFHMGLEGKSRIALSKTDPENGIRPSVSYLFRSAARASGGNMIGVLLTGMGKDGADELKLMKERGAVTIAQDRKSSVVFGMPGEAVRLGAAQFVLPPDKIPKVLESMIKGE